MSVHTIELNGYRTIHTNILSISGNFNCLRFSFGSFVYTLSSHAPFFSISYFHGTCYMPLRYIRIEIMPVSIQNFDYSRLQKRATQENLTSKKISHRRKPQIEERETGLQKRKTRSYVIHKSGIAYYKRQHLLTRFLHEYAARAHGCKYNNHNVFHETIIPHRISAPKKSDQQSRC